MSATNSVVNTLVHRAIPLCDQEYQNDELKHIEKALNKNGYPLISYTKPSKNKQESNLVEDQHKGVMFILYVKGVSTKFAGS